MPAPILPAPWSRQDAERLLPGQLTSFSASILDRAVERVLRDYYAHLGHALPASAAIWQREEGRAYLNEEALATANQAVFGSPSGPVSIDGGLLAGGQARRYSAFLRMTVEEAAERQASARRWYERVVAMSEGWRQATILQVMEEIEPKAEAMLAQYWALAEGLAAHRRQIERWLAEWLPGDETGLRESLMAGLDEASAQVPGTGAGHWSDNPLEASSPRWVETGLELDQQAGKATAGRADSHRNLALRQEALASTTARLGRRRRQQLQAALDRMEQIAGLLADSFDHLVLVMAAARLWTLGVAGEARADGRLSRPEEVFLLELEELKQMMTGEWSHPEQVRDRLAQRRA